MATLGEVITRIQNLVNSTVNVSVTAAKVEPIVQTRYEELYEEHLWRAKLKDFTITLVAQIDSAASNTVTVTQGDATVVSSGTPFAASYVGRQIQIGDDVQYYFVGSFTDTSNIELGTGEGASIAWAASTASSTSWRIFQTIYTLPSDADEIIALAGTVPITEGDGGRPYLDTLDAERLETADHPREWVYVGEDSSGVPEIELWPTPSTARLLRGQYSVKYASLASTATIKVNVPVLIYAATADVLHMLSATTGPEESNIEQMALFYERKSLEKMRDVKPKQLAHLSPTRTMSRRGRTRSRLRGTDYETTHHIF